MSKRPLDICNYKIFVRTIIVTVALLVAGALALVVCGSLAYYLGALVLLLAAALLSIAFLWFRKRMWQQSKVKKIEVSTISNYYSQVPLGRKSDFPMGPYLIMTLPTLDTPQHVSFSKRRSKNLPPLASVENLTPSLLSSSCSIDSVV